MTMRGSRERNARARYLEDAALHAAIIDAFAASRAANRAAAEADAWLHALRAERRRRRSARHITAAIELLEA